MKCEIFLPMKIFEKNFRRYFTLLQGCNFVYVHVGLQSEETKISRFYHQFVSFMLNYLRFKPCCKVVSCNSMVAEEPKAAEASVVVVVAVLLQRE